MSRRDIKILCFGEQETIFKEIGLGIDSIGAKEVKVDNITFVRKINYEIKDYDIVFICAYTDKQLRKLEQICNCDKPIVTLLYPREIFEEKEALDVIIEGPVGGAVLCQEYRSLKQLGEKIAFHSGVSLETDSNEIHSRPSYCLTM